MKIFDTLASATHIASKSALVGLLSGGGVAYAAKALKTALKVNMLSFAIASAVFLMVDQFLKRVIHYRGNSDLVKLVCKAVRVLFAGIAAFHVYAYVTPYTSQVHWTILGGLTLLSLYAFHRDRVDRFDVRNSPLLA